MSDMVGYERWGVDSHGSYRNGGGQGGIGSEGFFKRAFEQFLFRHYLLSGSPIKLVIASEIKRNILGPYLEKEKS